MLKLTLIKRAGQSIKMGLAVVPALMGLLGALATGLAMAPAAQAACTALPTGNGTATFTVSIPSTATYRFWAHMYSPSSGNDAMYLQVDNTYCSITVGNAAVTAGTFTWVDYQSGSVSNKINMSLSAGNHTVELAGLDTGVGVDKVLFASDTACTPTGDGSNCVGAAATPTPTAGATVTPSPTVVVTPPPGSGGTTTSSGGTPVSGTITLPKAAAPGTTRSYILDGKLVSGNQVDTTDLSNGTHTLKIIDTAPDGKTTVTSQKLDVNNVKGFWNLVLAWLKQPLVLGGVGFGILMAITGGVIWWNRRHPGPISLPLVGGGMSNPAATPPPLSQPIYPDKTDPL
ncbi:MAG TPA: hypothetical protein VHQ86_05845, partial [Candidatus Saccharimonadia bacterium]|nr:hypothetical protein [Candidatus Saccharimonadia bacterium]